jgi:serine/threonine-protein kinase
MDELDIDVGDSGVATFFFDARGVQPFTVTEGMVSVRLSELGDLPNGSRLSGRLIFGERVYGRLTRARSPDGKIDVPVCVEREDTAGGRGLLYEGERGPTTAKVLSHFYLRAVKEFE